MTLILKESEIGLTRLESILQKYIFEYNFSFILQKSLFKHNISFDFTSGGHSGESSNFLVILIMADSVAALSYQ